MKKNQDDIVTCAEIYNMYMYSALCMYPNVTNASPAGLRKCAQPYGNPDRYDSMTWT